MKNTNLQEKNEIKITIISFIAAFLSSYLWMVLLYSVVDIYEARKLGDRAIGRAARVALFNNNQIFSTGSYIIMEFIIPVVVYFVIKKYNKGKFSLDLIGMKLKKGCLKQLVTGLWLELLMFVGTILVCILFGLTKFQGVAFSYKPANDVIQSVVISFFFAAFPGFCEEILFRGVILNNLMKRKGKTFALIISSLAFSMFHIGVYHDFTTLFWTFAMGLMFGYLYIITESLYLPIGLHFARDFYSAISTSTRSNVTRLFIFHTPIENYNFTIYIETFVVLIVLLILVLRNTNRKSRVDLM